MKITRLTVFPAVFLIFAFMAVTSSVPAADEVKMVVTAAFVSEKRVSVYEDIASYIIEKRRIQVNMVITIPHPAAGIICPVRN